MKRTLILLAVVVLLLCGCAGNIQSPTSSPITTDSTQPDTKPSGLYDPENNLEILTGGAVQGYRLHDDSCSGVVLMGSDLLLFSGAEITTLTVLTGDDLTPTASVTLSCFIYPEDPGVQVSENGVGYYDSEDHAVVFLDRTLHEISRTSLPEGAEAPVLSPDLVTVYYCAGNQIQALDLHSGISRLVKEQNCVSQRLTGIFCGGEVLSCSVIDSDGGSTDVYLSTQTGQTLYSGCVVEALQTFGESYFASLNYGSVRELAFRLSDGQEMRLEPLDYHAAIFPELSCGGVVTASATETGCTLNYYDLASGLRTASVELPATDNVMNLAADPERNVLWFVCDDRETSGQILYAWTLSRSTMTDNAVYTQKRYTADAPDTEGLALCQEEAQRLGEKYGVEILLWQDALSVQPEDYTYVPEYLVSAYRWGLQRLDAALARFPDGFLKETASQSGCGVVRIALVRSILGDEAHGTLASVAGLQYWNNGDACIGLDLSDSLEQNFYHELCHIIETRVYASTTAYDDWNQLNPSDFSYDYDYLENQYRTDYQYLEGSSRAFIDMYAMSFPTEDRARVFEYAMIDAGTGCFTSEIMQRKLKILCEGIRKAYGLKDFPEVLPWERYLEEPLIP